MDGPTPEINPLQATVGVDLPNALHIPSLSPSAFAVADSFIGADASVRTVERDAAVALPLPYITCGVLAVSRRRWISETRQRRSSASSRVMCQCGRASASDGV